ncbi:ATP-dependent RNA helicase HrpA [Marinagarivorans algicola]|uniref:ATP-dependent RNA helicase HrpA n=1 Tax=Marinagarivorans algicola TaxID=1513270 RepID=UPI0009E8068B|nr:ATP-dependent RNA helicase HrpA [Marinagarivorans algicola]
MTTQSNTPKPPLTPTPSAVSVPTTPEHASPSEQEPASLPALPDAPAFYQQLDLCVMADKRKLRSAWFKLQKLKKQNKPVDKALAALQQNLQVSQRRVLERKRLVPTVTFDDNLPVSQRRDEIAKAINDHQVVVIAGETGSGKTTQIPKICLTLGRGVNGLIGHTQPRRIAARTVASRIAQELQTELGSSVGYQVRFNDASSPLSHIKLMTDGILLAEIQNDPLLEKYDTLIIDEAHERSLNIDFLLGYIRQILPKRKELKVIITSATIDVERFSKHFFNAPIISVSGRTFPVEVLYRPWQDEQEDEARGIVNALEEILTLPKGPAGDILVFLPGEREIRETALAIRRANFPMLEVLPFYARLSLADQNRAFQPHKGRRVVLATNVAETSITVPGIGYVIDPGTARISRYSSKSRIQRLPVEPVSQASANQRAGRCGRISRGVCVRLYSEEDFASRTEFTDPEILRTSLAAVVLQMQQLNVGDIRDFPFLEPPEGRAINDAFKELEQLQALDARKKLTPAGRKMLALPLEPRFSRILISAHQLNCLHEVLIIIAGLTIQDPRERPHDKQQAADEKHRRFKDDDSDFIAYFNLWQYAEEQRQDLSQNAWRNLCGKEFLSFLRLREWRELHHQLLTACKQVGLTCNKEPASYDAIHQSLLVGLFDNVAIKNEESREREYLVARNRKAVIFPGSSQFKKTPRWLVSANYLETTKVYAHTNAKIDPLWLRHHLEHLLKHHYYQPHYSTKNGQVMAFDKVTLFGLVVADKIRIDYTHIDALESRKIFIRESLVEGKYGQHKRRDLGAFFTINQQTIKSIGELEDKSRRRDILVDDEIIFDFYDERIPADVCGLISFESWRKKAERDSGTLLHIPKSLLMQHSAEHISENAFPNEMTVNGVQYPLFYHFDPGHNDDGVSIGVPASVLHSFSEGPIEWLVPGLIREKCIALVKGLPKQWRKQFVPVPDYVDKALARIKMGQGDLLEALARELRIASNVDVPKEVWAQVSIDDYYKMNIRVLDDRGQIIDRHRHLSVLRERYRGHVQQSLQQAGSSFEKSKITQWDFGELPKECSLKKGPLKVQAFPALCDTGDAVDLKVLDNPADAHAKSRYGVARLLLLGMPKTVKYLRKELLKNKDIGLSVLNLGNRAQVVDDLLMAVALEVCCTKGELPRTQAEFNSAIHRGENALTGKAQALEKQLLSWLKQLVGINKAMKANKNALVLAFTFSDIKQQLQGLFYKGFFMMTPLAWLEHYTRYLNAIEARLEKAPQNPQKDKLAMQEVAQAWHKHQDLLEKQGANDYARSLLWQEYRYMIEELRVSLFAQTLKTAMPVSAKRLKVLWQQVLAEFS